MTVTIEDQRSVAHRLDELGLRSAAEIGILPRGFDSASAVEDLVHEAAASTLAKLLAVAGLSADLAQPAVGRLPILQENAGTWIGPTIFIAFSVVSANPMAVAVALNVLSDYISEFFRGTMGPRRARFDIVLEDASGACKRIHYDGPAEGLEEVRKTVRGLGFHGGE